MTGSGQSAVGEVGSHDRVWPISYWGEVGSHDRVWPISCGRGRWEPMTGSDQSAVPGVGGSPWQGLANQLWVGVTGPNFRPKLHSKEPEQLSSCVPPPAQWLKRPRVEMVELWDWSHLGCPDPFWEQENTGVQALGLLVVYHNPAYSNIPVFCVIRPGCPLCINFNVLKTYINFNIVPSQDVGRKISVTKTHT